MIARKMTWNESKESCSNLNLTMYVPDTRIKTGNLGFGINGLWPADSFERYWLGYQEIDGEWVIKLEPVKTSYSKY